MRMLYMNDVAALPECFGLGCRGRFPIVAPADVFGCRRKVLQLVLPRSSSAMRLTVSKQKQCRQHVSIRSSRYKAWFRNESSSRGLQKVSFTRLLTTFS